MTFRDRTSGGSLHEAAWFLLLCGLLVQALFMGWIIAQRSVPFGDEVEYLQLARSLRDGAGYHGLVQWRYVLDQSLNLDRPEANRSPGLPGVIAGIWLLSGSLVIRPLWILSSFLFLLSWFVLFFILRRRFSSLTAAASVMLTGLLPLNLWLATRALPESFFLLLFILVLLVLSRGGVPTTTQVLMIACILGCASYFRPNAMLLVAGISLSLLCERELSFPSRFRLIAVLCLVYSLVRLPWLYRNLVVFGDPFYSELGYFIWIDRFSDALGLHKTAPTMWGYLTSTSIFHGVVRMFRGLYLEGELLTSGNVFSRELHLVGALAPLWLGVPVIFPRMWRDRVLRAWFLVTLLHVLVFGWIGMGGLIRYIYLAFPLLIAMGFGGFEALSPRLGIRTRPLVLGVLIFLLFLQFRPLVMELRKNDLEKVIQQKELAGWIGENCKPGQIVMSFPDLGGHLYRDPRPLLCIPPGGIEAIQTVLRLYSCRLVVISAGSIMLRPELKQYWVLDDDGHIEERRWIPGWKLRTRLAKGTMFVYEVSLSSSTESESGS